MSTDKPDCSRHSKQVAGISDMEQLAIAVGDLHYQSLMNFLAHLSKKLEADALKDHEGGREKLASALQYAGMGVFESALRMEKVYELCKPFMDKPNTQSLNQ